MPSEALFQEHTLPCDDRPANAKNESLENSLRALVDETLSRFSVSETSPPLFCTSSTTSAVPVTQLRHLVNTISALRKMTTSGFATQAATTLDQLIFARASQLRHLHMFKATRQVHSSMKKILSQDFSRFVQDFATRISEGVLPTSDAFLFVGARILEQRFRLEALHSRCISAANACLDYLELDHWRSVSMVSIALFADVAAAVGPTMNSFSLIYANIVDILRKLDSRFPTADECSTLFDKYLPDASASMVGQAESESLKRLLRFSHEEIYEGRVKEELRKLEDEQKKLSNKVDLGQSVDRVAFLKEQASNRVSLSETFLADEKEIKMASRKIVSAKRKSSASSTSQLVELDVTKDIINSSTIACTSESINLGQSSSDSVKQEGDLSPSLLLVDPGVEKVAIKRKKLAKFLSSLLADTAADRKSDDVIFRLTSFVSECVSVTGGADPEKAKEELVGRMVADIMPSVGTVGCELKEELNPSTSTSSQIKPDSESVSAIVEEPLSTKCDSVDSDSSRKKKKKRKDSAKMASPRKSREFVQERNDTADEVRICSPEVVPKKKKKKLSEFQVQDISARENAVVNKKKRKAKKSTPNVIEDEEVKGAFAEPLHLVDFSSTTPVNKKKRKVELDGSIFDIQDTPALAAKKMKPLFHSTPMPKAQKKKKGKQ